MANDRTTAVADGAPSSSRQSSMVQNVVGRLEDLILEGSLQPGDSLPSEAVLAEELGVSRLTVREAIRVVQARGLAEISHGRRATVAFPNAAPLRDFFSASVRRDASGLMELLEVRLAVEVHAAYLAAANATRSDIAALELALKFMRSATGDLDAFNEADVRFHAAVASASGNRTLGLIVEGMEEPLKAGRRASIRGYREAHEDFEGLIEQHAKIFERIVARDRRGSAAAMKAHLSETRKDLISSFTTPGLLDP